MSSSIRPRSACRGSRVAPRDRLWTSTSGRGRKARPPRTSARSDAAMGRKLFVGNLSFETSDDDLKEAFSKVGACEMAAVIKDRISGRSRGFGFVEMGTDEEAQRAITELNGKDLRGRNISVREARGRYEGSDPRPAMGGSRFGDNRPPPAPASGRTAAAAAASGRGSAASNR